MLAEIPFIIIIAAGAAIGFLGATVYILWGRVFLQAGGSVTTPPIGRMPNKEEREGIQSGWPNLMGFTITGGRTRNYNCIGYALCSRDFGWQEYTGRLTVKQQTAWMDRAFRARGWNRAADCKPRKGYRKVAIYCDAGGSPVHAAKQLIGDWWESKLGSAERVCHRGTGQIDGGLYGNVCWCYEKRLQEMIRDAQRLAKRLKAVAMQSAEQRRAYREAQDAIKRWENAFKVEVGTMGAMGSGGSMGTGGSAGTGTMK